MNLEMIGVQVLNPELAIEIAGDSYMEFVMYLHGHAVNLEMVLRVLESLNPDGSNERLKAVHRSISMLISPVRDNVQELLRLAKAQGLQIGIVDPQPVQH